ncbi:MAG: hypothetical protein FD146_840 [Anaerolineaceae bacterium]|nr:MAG: hypothetical protein FD146_840 [Anaerolineaceae bacterium]
MKRLLNALSWAVGAMFFCLLFPAGRAEAACSIGSHCEIEETSCGDLGLCLGSGICTWGVCCLNYGPYCDTDRCLDGCSSNNCSGGVCLPYCDAAHGGTTNSSTQCPCGCTASTSGGVCKSCCLCSCGCIANTTLGGTCKTCCLASHTKGCISINTSGGVEGNICYFDFACYSDSGCSTYGSGPYAQINKYFGCIDCSGTNRCKFAPGYIDIYNEIPVSVYDSCVYKTSVCDPGECHPYTCVESANPACVNTGGTQSWDGCAYSCSVCPPSASPSPSPGTCTAATGLLYTRDGTTGVVNALSWTRGTGGTNQYLYVDDIRADVEAGCPGGGGCSGSGCCAIKNTDLGTGATGYSDLSILEAGRLYYWRVVTYAAACQAASGTALFVDSCNLSPTSIILRLDDPATPLTSQMYSSTDILRTDFSQTGATVRLSPTSDSVYTYETSVAPLAVGAGTVIVPYSELQSIIDPQGPLAGVLPK